MLDMIQACEEKLAQLDAEYVMSDYAPGGKGRGRERFGNTVSWNTDQVKFRKKGSTGKGEESKDDHKVEATS